MELNSNREQGYFEGGRRIGMPVIGAVGWLLPQTKTALPRPFGVPTFVGRTGEPFVISGSYHQPNRREAQGEGDE